MGATAVGLTELSVRLKSRDEIAKRTMARPIRETG